MKTFLQQLLDWFSLVAVLPLVAQVKLLNRRLGPDQAFQMSAQAVSLVPGIAGNYLRRAFYRLTLARCAPDVCIEFGTVLSQAAVELGRRVYIGPNCSIGASVIEDDTLLGSNVDVISGKYQHCFADLDTPIREQGGRLEKIRLGPDSWIGNSSVVMANVGAQSIVAAGSVVIDAVEPRTIVGGNPARFIRKR